MNPLSNNVTPEHRQEPERPLFSIITVTYNAEAVLEDTIQSVISQTYHHVEYIIVDGASKDGTLSIIDRYKDRITRIVSEPDKGLYDAMNKAFRMSTGDVVAVCNDILCKPNAVSSLVDALRSGGPHCIGAHSDLVYVEGEKSSGSGAWDRGGFRRAGCPDIPLFFCDGRCMRNTVFTIRPIGVRRIMSLWYDS